MKKFITNVENKFMSLSMSAKMSLIFTLIVFVMINIIYSIYANIYEEDMVEDSTMVFEQTAYLYEEKIGNLLESTESIIKAPFYFGKLQEELLAGESLSTESLRNLYYSVVASNINNSNKYVIMLYDSKGKQAYANASIENFYITQLCPDEWSQKAGEANGVAVLLPIEDPNEKYSFVIAENIISIESFTKIGFIAVAIPEEELLEIYDSIGGNADIKVMIYNGSDEVLFSSDGKAGLPEELEAAIRSSDYQSKQLDTKNYLGYCSVLQGNKYKIVVYEEKDVLLADLRSAQSYMRTIEILAIMVTIVLTIVMTQTVTRPLRKMTELMHKVELGNMSVRFLPKYSDEIGKMCNTFDMMLDKIDEMQRHLVEVNNAKKQVEIDALKGQINPHFMYNTIETFRMIAMEKEDEELSDLLWRFGRMMRYNITTMNEFATIRSELEYMQYYMDIQNCRYNGNILLICEVPEELKEYKVIKLLIQPIVENAVFHGLKQKASSIGYVKISIYISLDRCIIEISDNGEGIQEQMLAEIKETLKLRYVDAETTKYIGLRNVNERIKLIYGDDYGIQIDNLSEGGLMVTISLPFRTEMLKERIL